MRIQKTLILLSILGIVVAGSNYRSQANAATAKTITISPFLKEVKFEANEPTKDFQISITNNTAKTQDFKLSALDFGSLNDTGGIIFAGSNANALINKYGLANWLELGTKNLTLESGKSADVLVTIINDVTMRPGGHYAAIVASVANQETSDTNKITVNQKLSSLILATKLGGVKYDLKLNQIDVSGDHFRLPNKVTLQFNNPGNVHVVPRGTVKLISPGGKVVSQGVINEDSSFVLPEKSRQLEVDLSSITSPELWPTLYRVQVDYRYDGFDRFARKEKQLYYVNLPNFVLIIIVLTGGMFIGIKLKHKTVKKSGSSKA